MRRRETYPFSLFSFQDMITGLCGIMILLVLVMLVGVIQRKSSGVKITDVVEQTDLQKLAAEVDALTRAYQDNAALLSTRIIRSPTNELGELSEAMHTVTQQERQILALQSQQRELDERLKKMIAEKAETERARKEKEAIRAKIEADISKLVENELTIIPERGYKKLPVFLDCSGREVKAHFIFHKRGELAIPAAQVKSEVNQLTGSLDRDTSYFVLLIRPSSVAYAFELESLLEKRGFSTGRDPLPEDKILRFAKN